MLTRLFVYLSVYRDILAKKSIIFSCLAVLCFSHFASVATALSTEQRKLLSKGINYYNTCKTDDSSSGTTPTTGAALPENIAYKSAGNIPERGMTVGATYYGGAYSGGKWKPTNDDQNPGGNNDDSGLASYNNLKLAGRTAVAELGGGNALGHLPYQKDGKPNTKLQITYKGKSIIAEKMDWGTGNGDSHYKVDLWWETAKLLGVKGENPDIKIRAVSDDTPVTPIDGAATQDDSSQELPPECLCPTDDSSNDDVTLSGSENAEKVFNYFISKGLSDVQAAGALGNIMQESGADPQKVEGGGRSKTPTSGGWGLIQWTPGSKAVTLAKQADINGPIHELSTQLELLWGHMNNKPPITTGQFKISDYKKINDIKAAADYFEHHIEGAGIPMMANRYAYAKAALKKYGGNDPSTSTTASSSSSGGSCACKDNSDNKKTVVIDPGHGPDKTVVDQKTGLKMIESNNKPEVNDVWDVAQDVKADLEKEGYNVIMTKKSVDDDVTFRQRANIADDAKAAIAVSIHGDPDLGNAGEIYVQKEGLYRGSGGNKTTFSNDSVAQRSQDYADKFKSAREGAEGGKIVIKDNSFNGRSPVEPGNIPMVQLFSKTPWVYNERKMSFDKNKYAKGVVEGVKASLGSDADSKDAGSSTSSGCTSAGTGDLASTVKTYAWPDYHPAPYTKAKKEYAEAIKAATRKKQYVGGGQYPGIDCGGFVTRVMIDSGFEPKYNYSGKLSGGAGYTIVQEEWLRDNWTKISPKSTKDLEPGDVAINDRHTYMYVGKVDGFNSVIASASYGSWRAPMAGHETPADPSFNWYRKK